MSDTPLGEERLVFAVAPEGVGDGVPLIMIGLTDKGWEYCKDGKTHMIDLSSIGLPFKMIMFGTRSHAQAKQTILGHNERVTKPIDMGDHDFSIKPLTADQKLNRLFRR